MLKKLTWLSILIVALKSSLCLHAELLIIKNENGAWAPLDDQDIGNYQKISSILLEYEWPMCIASYVYKPYDTKLDVLFAPNQPNAEEIFIQNKIQESLGTNKYGIVFIPTCVYELYLIFEYRQLKDQGEFISSGAPKNILHAAQRTMTIQHASAEAVVKCTYEDIKGTAETRKHIYGAYRRCNNFFYPDAAFYINNKITNILLGGLKALLSNCTNAQMVSELIQKKIYVIAALFAEHAGHPIKKREISSQNPKVIDTQGILAQVIELEYEARKLNKAILIRGGSSVLKQTGGISPGESSVLAGDTILEYNFEKIAQAYKRGTLEPYSISFGNSLLAGCLRDSGATAYYYLTSSDGYAVLIDKKAYIEHQCHNLFFISPLAPIEALIEAGEMFHSRTKAAVVDRNKETDIRGIAYGCRKDPTGLVTVLRDPMQHASLFSQFLADNLKIVLKPFDGITEAYRQTEERKLRDGQAKAAKFYKAIRTVKPLIPKTTHKNSRDTMLLQDLFNDLTALAEESA